MTRHSPVTLVGIPVALLRIREEEREKRKKRDLERTERDRS